MDQLPWLDKDNYSFPDPGTALQSPNGLLALGGDLAPQRILNAYKCGIFPWYEEDQPLLWWSPDPRMVLFPHELHISRNLKKAINKTSLVITHDQAFEEVIEACAERPGSAPGTWITSEMIEAYIQLHKLGFAHSVEAWQADELVGGLYGLKIGDVFCGESMFKRQDDASKIAFVHLVQKLEQEGTQLIDCQVASGFLASFGAREISREDFISYLPESDT